MIMITMAEMGDGVKGIEIFAQGRNQDFAKGGVLKIRKIL